MDRDAAVQATKQGAIAACVSAAVTFATMIFAMLSGTDDPDIQYFGDPLIFFDIAIMVICAWFIFKKSRTAAVFMLLYFVLSKVIQVSDTGKFTGGFVAILFTWFYGRAVWGAFVFHRLEKLNNPDYKTPKKWIWFIAGPVIAIFALLVGIGAMTMSGYLPSTQVQSGEELGDRVVAQLKANGFVETRSDIKYFYTDAMFSATNTGTVLTDEKIIYYAPEGKEVMFYAIGLDEVTSVELVAPGGALSDAYYKVTGNAPDRWVQFGLSIEEDRHLEFISALRQVTVDKPAQE